MKMIVRKLKKRYEGFHLIPETAGKISNGVYVKDDGSGEMWICFAWGKNLHFKFLAEKEIGL